MKNEVEVINRFILNEAEMNCLGLENVRKERSECQIIRKGEIRSTQGG